MSYDDIVKRCNQYYKEAKAAHSDLEVFYRGQAKDWELKSKLQRSKEEDAADLFGENINWDENYSVFENFAHMQHYGEATRLIDFTTSLDIALFFACESEEYMNDDGVIYCCSYMGRNCEFIDVKLIMEIARLKKPIKVDEFAKLFIRKYSDDLDSSLDYEELALRILSWADHGFMIVPTNEEAEKLKEWNPRMYSQKGVFFVQGNKIQGKNISAMSRNVSSVTILNELSDIPSTISTSRFVDKIIIPHDDKEKILRILDSKGVNKKTLCLD